MENNKESVARLFEKAKTDMAADMQSRGIGAIIWDNATAGFQNLPEVTVTCGDNKDKTEVRQVMGLYRFEGTLYLIEEDVAPVNFNDFWNPDTEAAPTVVTLSEDIAIKDLGNPTTQKGYTTQGSLEEWTAIADCYFQALAQD
jgi:hypothetical protein